MIVSEIFSSIQGESTLQGLPCVFIRLSGCNLDCRYCDTRYAREGGAEMSINEIVKKASLFGLRTVCITGGEPLLQKDTPALVKVFLDRDWTVSIETNGSMDVSAIDSRAVRVIDIKCPGSGEDGSFLTENLDNRRSADEFKFVINDREDFNYAVGFVTEHGLADNSTVLFAPVYGVLDPQTLSAWILKEFHAARLNLQLHKYIWGDSNERNIIH